jgi:hypothetical protein
MAFVELNIYGSNDEIIKTFSTNRVRWGLIVRAVELEEKMNDSSTGIKEQISLLNDFVLSIFPDMTQTDVEAADYNDIKNVFKMVGNMAGAIDTKNE